MMQAAAVVPIQPAPTLSTYLNLAGVGFFLLFIGFSIIRALRNKKEDDVAIHVARGLSASQLPSAAVLIYAGFDPAVLAHLSGLNIGLVVAGVVLCWVSVKTMIAAPAKDSGARPAIAGNTSPGKVST